MTKRGALYYGWWIVGTCLAGLVVAGGSGIYCFGVFFPRLMQEFQWSRASVAAAISIYWIASGCAGPFVGRLLDVYGPKRVMLVGTFMSGASLALLSLTGSLMHLYLLYALMAVAHVATILVPYGFLISRWFLKKRGKAMGIATSGVSIGGVLLVPLTEFLIHYLGWRASYAILGILVACLLMPMILFVVKASPMEVGCLPDGAPMGPGDGEGPHFDHETASRQVSSGSPWTLGRLMRTGSFWLMACTLFCTYTVMFGVLMHQVPFVLDMGIPSATAALAFGFTALMGILGKLAIGFMADRFSIKAAVMFTLSLQLAGVLILMSSNTMAMLWLYAALFGLSMGGATLRPLLPTWLFGLSSLGTLQGAAQAACAAGSAVGPFFAGYIFDLFDSYYAAFGTFAVFCVLGLVCISLARPVPASQ